MNIREAILKAADKIESEPARFDFDSIQIPGITCGSPGCAIGWIAAYRGELTTYCWPSEMVERVLGIDDCDFYNRVDELEDKHFGVEANGRHLWMYDATRCAVALRLYADKYHPAEKPKHAGIPANVRAIFETERALCPTP